MIICGGAWRPGLGSAARHSLVGWRRHRRASLWRCLLLALLLASRPGSANGRFPAADQILVDPDDASHLLLRATFGLLQSFDGGQSWSWICEAAVGYMGDPALALLRGGNVLAAFFDSVGVSRERGCGWSTTPLDAQHRYPLDATLDPRDPARAWVLAVSVNGTLEVSLLSVNAAGTIDEVLPVGSGFVPTTVEAAPSDPSRLYVAGVVENTSSIVLRSDDRGRTWQRFAVPEYGALPLFISAVDPNDPARVYARIDGGGAAVAQPSAANDAPSDHVLVSQDAGESWQTVLSLETDLLGFALSPDGESIAVGGPGKGVYVASARELEFRKAAPVQVLRCLRWELGGLFACGQESLDGWTVARSVDGGQSFEALWHQQDLAPLGCPASSATGAACPALWADISRTIQARGDLTPEAPVPVSPGPAKAESGCGFGPLPSPARPSGPVLFALAAALAALRARGAFACAR